MDHVYMARRRADLADKVKAAKPSAAQSEVIVVNEKSTKSQTKSSSNIFSKALSFGRRSKSDEGFTKLWVMMIMRNISNQLVVWYGNNHGRLALLPHSIVSYADRLMMISLVLIVEDAIAFSAEIGACHIYGVGINFAVLIGTSDRWTDREVRLRWLFCTALVGLQTG
jgi:hypothetical protein